MLIRPIEPSDAEAYRSILLRTSDEDRYCRFFHAVAREPNAAEIARYTTPDAHMFGFIAIDEQPLGAVHGFPEDDGSMEFSVLVAGNARRRGVARALVARLLAEAPLSCTSVTAYSLAENAAFARLAQAFGMRRNGNGNFVSWTLVRSFSPLATPISARDSDADGDGAANLSLARRDRGRPAADRADALRGAVR